MKHRSPAEHVARALPKPWWKAHHALHAQLMKQMQQEEPVPEEERVTEEHFKELWATPVTRKEVTEYSAKWRGKYYAGDSRDFVRHHEQACMLFNCWMIRKSRKSEPQYISESPAKFAKRGA